MLLRRLIKELKNVVGAGPAPRCRPGKRSHSTMANVLLPGTPIIPPVCALIEFYGQGHEGESYRCAAKPSKDPTG